MRPDIVPQSCAPTPNRFGWTESPQAVQAMLATLPAPTFRDAAPHLADTGKGKVVLLYTAFRAIGVPFPLRNQTIGDCVSQGWACAADVLAAVQVAVMGQPEEWRAPAASEVIYAGSRVEIGEGRLGRGDGSIGAYAAKFVQQFGVVVRGRYGEIDLTDYDGKRARQWGMPRAGVPDALEPIAREHPVSQVTQVTTYEEARDAIANLCPVPVASNQGFTMRRDAEGRCTPRGRWPHQMCFIAVDDPAGRLLCQNSWGDYLEGGVRHDQPPGSFWVDADVVNRMLGQGDSFAASRLRGFPRQNAGPFALA